MLKFIQLIALKRIYKEAHKEFVLKLKKVLIAFFFSMLFNALSAQGFTSIQQCWLYKIMYETSSLKSNWDSYFLYKREIPMLPPGIYNKEYREDLINWSLFEDNVVNDSNLLVIDFDSLKNSSPGILAEASVKLALWELYSEFAKAFQNTEHITSNQQKNQIFSEMYAVLPPVMKKNGRIKKKYESVFLNLLNPSLSIAKKVYSLAAVKGLSPGQQKIIMDRWHKVTGDYISKKSADYFERLAGRPIYYNGSLLAAGEGSGSSGLLKEYEDAGDLPLQTGNGKGVGFFTYEMQLKRGKLVPKIESEISIHPLADEPTLLHPSLWGMDSNKKPLILIQKGDRSYLLFADYQTDLLSPDDNLSPGISYLDRMKELEKKEITDPLMDLKKSGGLMAIYQREDSLRNVIQSKIHTLELEIDSLQKLDEASPSLIDQRKRLINSYQDNMRDKELRLKEINEKITAEYRKIDKARERLLQMKFVLGPDIQKWVRNDSVYLFEDGTIFNFKTQDLIFYPDTSSDKITVKLLAASYSLKSKLKDEVQLYVNVTGGVNDHPQNEKVYLTGKQRVLYKKSVFFKPDEHKLYSNILLPDSLRQYCMTKKHFTLELKAMGVDSLLLQDRAVRSKPYLSIKNDSLFVQARRVDIELQEKSDTVFVRLKAFTDSGNTRLSKTTKEEFINVKALHTIKQTYNPGLSVLRLISVIRQLERELQKKFSIEKIEVVPLHQSVVVEIK